MLSICFYCVITGICVLLLLLFFWLTTYYRHSRSYNLVILKFTIKQLEIEAKCVSQSKMAAKVWNDLASPINTRGTEKRHQKYAFYQTQLLLLQLPGATSVFVRRDVYINRVRLNSCISDFTFTYVTPKKPIGLQLVTLILLCFNSSFFLSALMTALVSKWIVLL